MSLSWTYSKKLKAWRLRFKSNGVDKSFYSSQPKESKAKNECNEKFLEWKYGKNEEKKKRITVEKAWDLFIEDYYKRVKRTSANKLYAIGKAHISRAFSKKIEDMKKSDWQKILDDAFEKTAKSPATLKGIESAIRQLCKFASANGWIDDNKVPIYFQKPFNAKKKGRKILQKEEIARVFADSDNWYIHAFRFFILTGIRRGELCALRLDRDFKDGFINIKESLSHEGIITDGKTKQANRYIALGEQALKEIETHLQRRKKNNLKSDYLFCDEYGKQIPARKIGNEWRKWRVENNINCTIHELRHTHISFAVRKANETLEDLKEVFGHSEDMNTKAIYVHDIDLSEEEKKERFEKLKRISSNIEKALKD